MRDWIVILVLYVVVLAGFGWCGGICAAGKSIEDWAGAARRHEEDSTAR